jgi:hypothetical protein
MEWIYRIRRKTAAALLFALLLIAIGVKNMVDSYQVTELGDSFKSVYEDRLLVEGYIYRLSENLYQKKLLFDDFNNEHLEDFNQKIGLHNLAINALIIDYANTKLTKEEALYFDLFKKNINEIATMEQRGFESGDFKPDTLTKIDQHLAEASRNLQHLSDIQIAEGKILRDQSAKIVEGSSFLTQLEFGIIILAGVVIVVIIAASGSIISKVPDDKLTHQNSDAV